nr:HAMP domain-containing sensor histidine kinase [uncultured Dysosmobacter sp.]
MPERNQKRKAMRVRSLRQRWILNSALPVFMLLALAVGGMSIGISNYYYKGMLDGLERQARAQAGAFIDYFMDQGFANYLQRANQAISDYTDKERVELQFLSSTGGIQASSTSNLTVGTHPGTEDISRAVETNKISYYRGADPKTGEQILAVSHPLTVNGKVVGVMRFVTSMRQVTVQVRMTVLAVVLVAVLCLLLVVSSNLIFINNVVEPVAVVSDAAKRISQGSYGFTLENKYTGELGELIDNINDMSMKISQNEKMKTEFISSVSHELRTPLTAISGWGETLLADPDRDQIQLHRGLRIILNESRRLSGMVEELLEFSKMEDGRFTLQLEDVDLQAEFEDSVFTYRELFRQEGIELHYEPGVEVLPAISGDPERLKQVFCNVLDNAAKHGGAGKRIDASMTREGSAQVIRVRDYGPGIPEAELPYVKQKFYKGSSKARGSGIGLAVCDEIVRLHGGVFEIANAEGGGAVVTIRLPEKG